MRSPGRPASTPNQAARWLPWLFAAGAVFWLVQLTQAAAMAAAPVGRDQLSQALVNAGITDNVSTVLVVYFALIFSFEAAVAAAHAVAFYGLRAFRPWGWIAAVIVAGAWSLVLVGIPVFIFLLQRRVRQAYGIL